MSPAMPRLDALTEPPIVGRYYLVPCVKTPRDEDYPPAWVPVLGPMHEDRTTIGFPFEHYHHDLRFSSPAALARISRDADAGGAARGPLDQVLADPGHTLPAPEWRRRRCHRAMPEASGQPWWLAAMERAHAGARLKACRICPHRGLPLASLPVAPDGTVTCPGHGLTFNISTGRLVRRAGSGPR